MKKFRVLHYINQFSAGIGGEEMAHIEPEIRDGIVGPGMAFNAAFGSEAEIVNTIICGDSFFGEKPEIAKKAIRGWIKQVNPDLIIAGPAFNAGRYGFACAGVCELAKEMEIPVITGMYKENPGADMIKDKVLTVATKNSAAGMRDAVSKMAPLALKVVKGEKIGASCQEGYLPNGVRVNFFEEERGSKRAVDMLIKKLGGKEYTTEYPMPDFDRVPANPAVKDLSKCKVALVTSGGIVPKGNPDRIESSSASKFGEYDIAKFDDLTSETHETAHGGYDPLYANQDPDRVLPVDVLRDLVKEKFIGSLHNLYYATVGNGTAVRSAKKYAAEIATRLKRDGVDVVILTST